MKKYILTVGFCFGLVWPYVEVAIITDQLWRWFTTQKKVEAVKVDNGWKMEVTHNGHSCGTHEVYLPSGSVETYIECGVTGLNGKYMIHVTEGELMNQIYNNIDKIGKRR